MGEALQYIGLLGLVAIVALGFIALLGVGSDVVATLSDASSRDGSPIWRTDASTTWGGERAKPPADLDFTAHSHKHDDEALDAAQIYQKMRGDGCVVVRRFCSGRREVYVCQDSGSMLGVLIVEGADIVTGFASRAGYVRRQIDKERWYDCR